MFDPAAEQHWRGVFERSTEDPARQQAKTALVTGYLPLVYRIAWRYRNRGEPLADLVQVGSLALLQAVERFDPNRGTPFERFATPTIIGEIKRHFRDHSWPIHIPRDLQELSALVRATSEMIEQRAGYTPAPQEISAYLGIGVDQVVVALDVALAYRCVPIERVENADDVAQRALHQVEDRLLVRSLLESLAELERIVLTLRFFGGWSQRRIAASLGCSQMQVSRIQVRALQELRISLEGASDRRRESHDDADHG